MATALITGGTSGIGAAFARELASRGFDLVLVARDEGRLASSAAEYASAGINVETMSADLADERDVARVVVRIEDAAHPIDMVVNNAGFGVHVPLTSADTAHHLHAFDVMCRAVLVLGAAAGRSMRARGSGTIINISSLQTYLSTGSYAAMKAWVTAFSQSLSVELRGTGVTATAVLPGWVRTEWHAKAGNRRSGLPDFLWSEPETIVRAALRDSGRGRVVCIPTVRYRVLGWFARHLPLVTIRFISSKLSSSRTDEASEPHPMQRDSKGH